MGKSPQRKSRNVLCLITTFLVKKNMMMSQTQTSTGRPVSVDHEEEHEIDFRVPGSTSTSGSVEAMILSKTTPTYSLLFFEMTIFRNSIRNETELYCP